jgi:DNA-binding transcriptional LysR family regulator
MELEGLVGLRLFARNHQLVELAEPGRHFVQEARNALLHAERAVLNATAASRGAEDVLNLGRSAYIDPYIVTTLLSIQLPLFPGLKIKQWSNTRTSLRISSLWGNWIWRWSLQFQNPPS